MGKEGAEQVSVQYADLMSNLQKQFLDNYIRGVMGSMQDFTLGSPFPGYTEAAYTPAKFHMYGYSSGHDAGSGALSGAHHV